MDKKKLNGLDAAAINEGRAERQQRKIMMIASIAIFVVIGILISGAFLDGVGFTSYYMEVDEVLALKPEEREGRTFRIAGDVDVESIQWDPVNMVLTMDVIKDDARISTWYHGIKPDNLENEDASVVVLGTFREDGVFEVTQLLVQCPSKYEAADVSEYK